MPLVLEVPEDQATGTIAETYADIRATQGLALVNLIWRHLATRPGALDWAWTVARPLYADGIARAEAARLTGSLELPSLPRVSGPVCAALGLADADRQSVAVIIEAYNQGNSLNLVALSALLAEPDPGAPPLTTAPAARARAAELPPIPALAALAPPVRELVLELNAFGLPEPGGAIVASLYRHLAPWPAYLALAWAQLAPLAADGRLRTVIARTRHAAETRARSVAAGRARPPAGGGEEDIAFARAALARFLGTAISRMVPIGLMLARSLR